MATLYVRDDGSDTSPYDTWAKAANKLATALADAACVAGSTVYVCSEHTEDEAATKTINASSGTKADPIIVITVDSSGDPEPPAATDYESMEAAGTPGDIETTTAADDINFDGEAIYYGLTFDSADNTNFGLGHTWRFRDCTFTAGDNFALGGSEATNEFEDCSFSMTDYIFFGGDAGYVFRRCVFSSVPAGGHFSTALSGRYLIVEDCDLSNEATLFANTVMKEGQYIFRRCKLATGWEVAGTVSLTQHSAEIIVESCDDGTHTKPIAGLNEYHSYYGKIEHDEAEYRTGGASDGETSYSWKFTCNTNTVSRHCALRSPPIAAWKDAGSETLTVYIAHDAVGDGAGGDLQDDECWLEIEYPDEAANPNTTAQGEYTTTLPGASISQPTGSPLAAAADLTNEGSDVWQNTPTTYQQITATLNPAEPGPVIVRVCLATGASSIVWVDPKIYLA